MVFPDFHGTIIQVAAGSHHTAALTDMGEVFCWGSNQHGQCGQSPEGTNTEEKAPIFALPQLIQGLTCGSHVTKLKSGWSHLLAVTGLSKLRLTQFMYVTLRLQGEEHFSESVTLKYKILQ